MAWDWIKNIFSGGVSNIVDSAADTVDRFVHTKEEQAEAEMAKRRLALEAEKLRMEMEHAYLRDRQSARDMYEHDSALQKIVAITFLVLYGAISGVMVWFVFGWLGGEIPEVPTWGISLISSVFGAMSSKVNTIVDFLFGGSQGERDQRQVQSRFEEAARQRREQE